jgi:hypothetical protein
MNPSLFFTAVLPLALIVFVLVGIVYYLLKKSEETKYEKEMKVLRKSLLKGEIDKKTFLYIRDKLKAEIHYFEESQRMNKMLQHKKIDWDTYLRLKEILEMRFNERLSLIQIHHNIANRPKKDFELYLKAMLENHPIVKNDDPNAWQPRAARNNRES